MPASFFHGVEVVEVKKGAVPIQVVRSGVVGLVGTAPSWAVQAPAVAPAPNVPTLVSSPVDAEDFGPLIQGYSIPYALAAIEEQGAGQAIVVNVFDPTRHYTTVASSPFNFPASGPQVVNLGHMGICSGVTPGKPVVKNQAGSTTYVEGTDYTVDYVNGLVTQKTGGAMTVGEAIQVTFSYADPTKVTDADIIGTVTGGVYTGLQALLTTFATMGFFARVLIAPGFSQNEDVAAAMIALATSIRAMALIDSAPATPIATAIANRGTAGQAFDGMDRSPLG